MIAAESSHPILERTRAIAAQFVVAYLPTDVAEIMLGIATENVAL